jgi:glycosyltransferase involved in cell wall biosynthesis
LNADFAYITADITYFLSLFYNTDWSLSIHAWDIFAQPQKEVKIRLQRATNVRCCSKFAKKYITQTIGDIGKEIVVKYHPTPVKQQSIKKDEERQGFLFIGRLEEKKGGELLFYAFKEYIENGGSEVLTIIGDGKEFKALRKLKYQLKLDDYVKFKGELSHAKAMQHLASSKCLIHPSLVASNGDCDGIPNVIREAIVYETFVITTAVGGITEIIEHKKNGYIIPTNNCSELTKSLTSIS